ncbi:MAG: hypothetical protein ACRYFX_05085 [Janthinobacterium lividum]
MKKLASLFALLGNACSPCRKLPLSEADRAWVAAYPTIGRQLTFRSPQGNALHYHVAVRVDTYTNLDCNWLEIGLKQPAHFHVTLRTPTATPNTIYDRDDLTLYLVKWSKSQPAKLDFRMAGLEAYINEEYDNHRFRLEPRPCTLQSSGRSYPRAYYFEASRNAIGYRPGTWRSFYWDQQAGLLRLEAADGEAFELVDE